VIEILITCRNARVTHESNNRGSLRGKHILLDEPVELEPNTKLLVTVLPKDIEREEWLDLLRKGLEAAYDNGEQDYSLDVIKEPNPEYESR
jgi:hypothetical protein